MASVHDLKYASSSGIWGASDGVFPGIGLDGSNVRNVQGRVGEGYLRRTHCMQKNIHLFVEY
jgi:hypothetical protein